MPEAHKRAYRHPKYKTSYRVPPESIGKYSQAHQGLAGQLRAKNDDAQKREAAIGCAILNRMFEMGEPLSYVVG
jgi:hypothetical protein